MGKSSHVILHCIDSRIILYFRYHKFSNIFISRGYGYEFYTNFNSIGVKWTNKKKRTGSFFGNTFTNVAVSFSTNFKSCNCVASTVSFFKMRRNKFVCIYLTCSLDRFRSDESTVFSNDRG